MESPGTRLAMRTGMSRPRRVVPGATVLVSRRCSQRLFLLSPSPIINGIVGYVLAVAARRYSIQIHAFCVLSNHLHLILTDPLGRLPAFEQYLNSLVGRAVNASLGRWEDFWAPNTYSAVTLLSPEDVVAKTAYVLANPVAAGLVQSAREWPGLWSSPESIGGDPLEFARPTDFFKPKGSMPKSASLQLHCPPGFASAGDFQEQVRCALAELEAQAAAKLRSEGSSFIGVWRVLAQKPTARPATSEPRRGLNPRVASRDKWKRIEALTSLVEFLRRYRAAWSERRSGGEDVVFPA